MGAHGILVWLPSGVAAVAVDPLFRWLRQGGILLDHRATELYTTGLNLSVADPYGEDVKPVARPPAGHSAPRDRDKKPRSSEGTGL
jgi:hypothetical protein